MSLLEEIQRLGAKDIMKYLSIFLASIAPGFLILYYYKPDLVKEYTTVKIIIFSSSLTLPLLFANITIVDERSYEKDPSLETHLIAGALYTFIIYYVPLFAAYLFNWPFIVFIWVLLGLEAFFIINYLILTRKKLPNKV